MQNSKCVLFMFVPLENNFSLTGMNPYATGSPLYLACEREIKELREMRYDDCQRVRNNCVFLF